MDSFQKYIFQKIPITESLGIQSIIRNENEVQIAGELKPNINHKGTVFGGSQFALCALGGYALLWTILEKNKIKTENIVIKESNIKYLRPIGGNFAVKSFAESLSSDFLKQMNSLGKGYLIVRSDIYFQNKLCTKMIGEYVVLL